MKMSQKHRIVAGGVSLVAALFALKGAVAQYNPGGMPGSMPGTSAGTSQGANAVAVSNMVDQHIHSIALTANDVATLIGSLGNNGSISFESSSGYEGGAPSGVVHTHTVTLTLADLQQLQATGTVTVRSSETLNHTHDFTFLVPAQCPGVMPSPSASPTMSPSPSPSVSVSPSPSPSVSPSASPSPSPSGSPSPFPTLTIIPLPHA